MSDSGSGKISELKTKFVEEIRLSGAISDAMKTRKGRRVFKKDSSEKEKKKEQERRRDEFREELRLKLREYASQYTAEVKDEAHIENIRNLAEHFTKNYKDILEGEELVFGVAQKALNVYLKSLWCAGENIIPPHCPFDSDILDLIKPKLPRKRKSVVSKNPEPANFKHGWTDASEADYRTWVTLAKAKAGQQSLPEWELAEWQTAQDRERTRIVERIAARKKT